MPHTCLQVLDRGDAGEVVIERPGVFGQQRDHEEVRVVREVLHYGGDAVRIDRLQGVQQYERHRLVEVVDEIPRQREDQARDLAFTLGEVADGVLVGRAVVGRPDDVELEAGRAPLASPPSIRSIQIRSMFS